MDGVKDWPVYSEGEVSKFSTTSEELILKWRFGFEMDNFMAALRIQKVDGCGHLHWARELFDN